MNYIIGPNGSFVPEDELYHWKYIKREKQPNGKWRYFYKDDKYETISNKYYDALKKEGRSRAIVSRYGSETVKSNYEQAAKQYKRSTVLRPQYEKAKKRYERSAGHKIADFLNKTSDEAHKAKLWVKKLFEGKNKTSSKKNVKNKIVFYR